MSTNDIHEMESMTETEEMEAEMEMGMIEEGVGKENCPYHCLKLRNGSCSAV